MCGFWNDYIKAKYSKKAKLCYTDTDSFINHIKTKDFYEDIADDVEERLDTSNYCVNLGKVAWWVKALSSESEGSRFKPHEVLGWA